MEHPTRTEHAHGNDSNNCDGSRPKCTVCINLDLECIYTPSSTSTNVIVRKDGLAVKNRPDAPPKLAQIGALANIADIEDSVDAMGTVVFADEEDCGFFGPSSNIAFLRHLSHAVSYNASSPAVASCSSPTGNISLDGGFVNASRPPSPGFRNIDLTSRKQEETDIFALPSHEETSQLVHKYFTDTGILFPYIYPHSFLETYRGMSENKLKIRRTWLGLLNMMLAMVKITAPSEEPAAQRIATADVFYKRALGLCGKEMLRGTTLEVVQYLLLMGQYMQGTQKSVQAWTVHGLAVKAALQLGLHSKNASRIFSPQEQEIRKRTWYGSLAHSSLSARTLSMTLGRPAAIPDSFVRLDLPTNDINGDGPTEIPIVDSETFQMSVDFFNSTILLYKQLFKIVDLLYGQNLGCDPPLTVGESVRHILSAEQHLAAWEKSLPQLIELITVKKIRDANGEMPDRPRFYSLKFSVILTLRYLHLRILLHRPILVKFLDACGKGSIDPHEERLLQQIGFNSMRICMESAMSIIDIIHELVHSSGWRKSLLGAWWYSLYYTFHSALVLLGTIWVGRNGQPATTSLSCDIDKVVAYPSQAISTLHKLDCGNRIVDRCRYYLEQFHDALNPRAEEADMAHTENGTSLMDSSGSNTQISPLGLEFGEFMIDGDFWTLMNQQRPFPSE
ncbi:C6 transcription factor [Penicillium odoratum]|uniref:C6 transcription factor n=1 Tax=Penicillium odoratum TaxID=1167516 RepID=UPI002547026C|nr:C6 transcription factor [Penicillium odoratum]KAJ5753289.1 C6 transcription factor [Penicillium odoratum]